MEALMVIDVQNGFITEENAYLKKRILNFVKEYKRGPIIITKYINNGGPIEEFDGYHKMKDSWETDLIPGLEEYGNYIFTKNTYTSITPEVKKFLVSKKINKVYLIGISTDCCVLKTALDLFEMGIRPIILEDLCGSSKKKYHKEGLSILKRNLGENQVQKCKEVNNG